MKEINKLPLTVEEERTNHSGATKPPSDPMRILKPLQPISDEEDKRVIEAWRRSHARDLTLTDTN